MLSADNRATRSDIETLKGARPIRTAHLIFTYRPSVDGKTHLSCSVSKKVAKRAVDRNYLKRRCRHVLREAIPHFPTQVVGIVRVMNAQVTWEDLQKEVGEIVEKLSRS